VLFGHYLVLRGENRRIAELADLAVLQYPLTEGPTACFAIVLQITAGKTNKSGSAEYIGAMRHKNPLLCSIGALAQYFYWRWHISSEEPPIFKNRQSWYGTKLLVGNNKRARLSYAAQYSSTVDAFAQAGITSIAKTHVMHSCGACAAELHGVSERQVSYNAFLYYFNTTLLAS
jgi:hypothetical protein